MKVLRGMTQVLILVLFSLSHTSSFSRELFGSGKDTYMYPTKETTVGQRRVTLNWSADPSFKYYLIRYTGYFSGVKISEVSSVTLDLRDDIYTVEIRGLKHNNTVHTIDTYGLIVGNSY